MWDCWNTPGKGYIQHDKAYVDFKYLPRRNAANNILQDKAFDIAKDPRIDGYERGFTSLLYKFFDEKNTDAGALSDLNNS